MCSCFACLLILTVPSFCSGQSTQNGFGQDPLLETLQSKGLLTSAEVAAIRRGDSHESSTKTLATLLLRKGLITKVDYDRIIQQNDAAVSRTAQSAIPGPPLISPAAPAATERRHNSSEPVLTRAQQPPNSTEPGAPSIVERSASIAINEALAPVRVFPVGGVALDDHPPISINGVGFMPYGFIKTTVVEDSSSPNGDDFPLPGFISDTGPDGTPEFRVKIRSTRFGINLRWRDINPKWTITGKIEGDFEGNYNRSDNRNLSSIRTSNPSLRVAWGRIDYQFNKSNSISALFGQDWTLYGSSTLPNILETTGLGVSFGTLYERDPQMRIGFTHKARGFTAMPEFSVNLPVSGLPPSTANLAEQLGYGERQGPDSNRPELQLRMVGQWQLDHAQGVPPAQIIFSGFEGRRTAVVVGSAIPTAYRSTFSTGLSTGSKQDGWDAEWQLPTRWLTLVGKVYSGADLRWFFANELYSFFNDATGLTNTVTVPSVDGASNVVLGTNPSGQQVVAPERPVRDIGGFVQLGLPLSRIFNANPSGRMAGWSIYGLFGEDQAKTRDINWLAGTRHGSAMIIGTLNYKMNKSLSFSFEQSLYTTRANPEQSLPLYRGVPSRVWNDMREEAGPIFFF